MRNRRKQDREPVFGHGESAFTLVELLVVLAIIGIIAALVAPQVLRYLGSARVNAAQAQLKSIGNALELYYLDTGTYPPTEEGLSALSSAPADAAGWNGPYINNGDQLKDGWGRRYLYENAPGPKIRVYSLGRDGKVAGDGLDSDLVYQVQ